MDLMLRRLARHGVLAPILIAVLSLLLSAGLARFAPIPQPQFHDEFSYLLAGDTFAHGRLTNPAHPFWRFFETFQVLQQPTYMSKYPPLQGIFLALGKILAHEAIAGAWISTAVACALSWWALSGWMPRRWATLGAAIIALHPMILKWNWSYWGGAPAMIGGCLVVGAAARWTKRPTVASGVAFGLGVGILLNSRPFEGAALTLLCVLVILFRGRGRQYVVGAPLLGATMALIPALAWTGYYNHRVTGHATQFPYMLYEKQYAATPPLVWLPPRPATPQYTHKVMRDYYLDWELPRYRQHQTLAGIVAALGEKSWSLLTAYFGSPVLVVPLIGAIAALRRDRKIRQSFLVAVPFLLAVISGLWCFPHYTAPATVLYFIVIVQGARHLRAWLRGRWIVALVLALHVVAAGVWCNALVARGASGWNFHRTQLVESLKSDGLEHLIFVRAGEEYYSHNEWVYNDADIDASRVVWARDVGDEMNRSLAQYFRGRVVWLLEVSGSGVRLTEYRP